MSDKPKTEATETIVDPVPVPEKGGWIDGETGQVYPVPPPDEMNPTAAPKATPAPEPKKKAS